MQRECSLEKRDENHRRIERCLKEKKESEEQQDQEESRPEEKSVTSVVHEGLRNE